MLEFLNKNPFLGIFTSMGGGFITFLESIDTILRYSSITLGLVIGFLTLYAKILEIKKRARDLKK